MHQRRVGTLFVKPQTVDRIMDCWLYRRVPVLVKFAAFTAGHNVERIEQAERFFVQRDDLDEKPYCLTVECSRPTLCVASS